MRAAPATGSRARCSNDLLRSRAENPGGRTASLAYPLLLRAVIDELGTFAQWPTLTERQRQVAGESVRLIRVDGRLVFSLPPRVNADWFLPENPIPEALRTIYGSVRDLQRWYLSIDLTAGARRTPTPWSASSFGRSRCASW